MKGCSLYKKRKLLIYADEEFARNENKQNNSVDFYFRRIFFFIQMREKKMWIILIEHLFLFTIAMYKWYSGIWVILLFSI